MSSESSPVSPLIAAAQGVSLSSLPGTPERRASSPWSSAPFPLERGLVDTRIRKIRPLIPPACLLEELPTPQATQAHIIAARLEGHRIIQGKDDRLLVVIGPCSIHDPAAAVEYARKLLPLAQKYKGDLHVCMRAYLEKPRTTVGWKGLINDPELDGSYNINAGLRVSRKLLLELNEIGLPLAMEMLDTITPQFLADLISWGAIGARTTESQLHRELVSGLSMPMSVPLTAAARVLPRISAVSRCLRLCLDALLSHSSRFSLSVSASLSFTQWLQERHRRFLQNRHRRNPS